jgi:hypothetical protein
MIHSLLITEGKDDVRALREIFIRELGFSITRNQSPLFARTEETLKAQEHACRLVIFAAGDRGRAAARSREMIVEGKLIRNGFTRLGVVFDPDDDGDDAWRSWIDSHILDEAWDVTELPDGYQVTTDTGKIELIPVPWDAGPVFDELDESRRSIERVAIGVLQEASREDSELVLKLLDQIQKSGRKISWKTAFRLLNAIRRPETEDGFFAQVFGQDRELRSSVRTVLESTELMTRLRTVGGLSPA